MGKKRSSKGGGKDGRVGPIYIYVSMWYKHRSYMEGCTRSNGDLREMRLKERDYFFHYNFCYNSVFSVSLQ